MAPTKLLVSSTILSQCESLTRTIFKDLFISQIINLSPKRKELHRAEGPRSFYNQSVKSKKHLTRGHGQVELGVREQSVGHLELRGQHCHSADILAEGLA